MPSFSLRIFFKSCLTLSLLAHSTLTNGTELTIELAEPKWQFLIDNRHTSPLELTAAEGQFSRTLQPLLEAKNYSAVNEELKNFTQDEEESAALSLLRGQISLAMGEEKAAQAWLEKSLEKAPNLASTHSTLGLIHLRNQAYQQAQTHLQKALELGQRTAQTYGQLAYANMQLNQAASAVSGYQQALFLDANNPEWQQGLLFAFVQAQANDQAQALVEQMINSTPERKDLWLLRSQIALQKGNQHQALSSLETALSLGEKKAENLLIAAQLHLTHGSSGRAVELMTRHELMNAKMSLARQNTLAQTANWLAYEHQWGNLKQLLATSKKRTIPAELKAKLSVSQAMMARHMKQDKQAEKALKDAIKIDPTLGEALIELAKLLADQKRYQQAELYYIRAAALDKVREPALLGQAQLAIEQMHYAQALSLLGQILEENPARTDLYANIRSLENLVRNQI